MGPKWIVVAVFGTELGSKVEIDEYVAESLATDAYRELVNRQDETRPTSVYLAPVRSEAHA